MSINYIEIQKNIEDLNKRLKNDYENNPSFNCLSALRVSMASSHNANKADEGFRNLLTQLYPDNAHYIYELLQNAQDANKDNKLPATVKFTLTDKQLEFEHNCKKLFDIKDIDSITGLGVSTKIDDKTNIGKFGVGFKSVFAITNTPEIISGKYHFIIEELFIPKLKSNLSENESIVSRFIFPFNNPKKPPEQAFREIENELHNLGSETLLFLRNINRLEYELPNNNTIYYMKRNDIGNNIIEIEIKNRDESKKYYWLRYDEDVSIDNEEGESVNCPISIAFKLQKVENKDTESNWKIIKTEQGKVCIFFPAEKEDSKLFFYIHAPFASTVARDSIRECDENNQLRDKISNLLVNKLIVIKERGLLTIDFLGILPNSQDNLSDFYKPIFNEIIKAFQNNQILPTKSGDYAPASVLFRGPVSISDIISDNDLSYLTEQKIPLWVKNAPQQNQREDRFLDDLKIKTWGDNELSICFNPRNQHDTDKIQNWIKTKPDNWLLKLYALFGEREINIGDELHIVRTTTNQHTFASDIYFPPEDENIPSELNFVKPEVFNKGDTEKRMKNAHVFLTKLGVKIYNEKEKLRIRIDLIAQKYITQNPNISETQHLEDIEQFVKYEENKELLKDKYFVLAIDGKYCIADTVCSSEIGELIECADLSSKYKKHTINSIYDRLKENIREKFYSLLGTLGAMNKLKVVVNEKNDIFYRNKIDYLIIGIENILPLINEDKYRFRFSLLIWNAICECNFNGNEKYKWVLPNDGRCKYPNNDGPSTIVKVLSSNPWLPDKDGILYNPKDISLDMLPNEFEQNYNQNSHILNALKFGENVRIAREKHKNEVIKREEAATTLGLSLELVKIINEARETGIDIVDFLTKQINNYDKETDGTFDPQKIKEQEKFPIGRIKDISLLQKNIMKEASKAKPVEYKEILQRIRISREKNIERSNIGEYYDRFCQFCGNKNTYWDIAQIFNIEKKEIGYKKELWYTNLSLCLNCARKYRKLRKNNELMKSFKNNIIKANINNVDPKKEIEIAIGEECIRFRHDHLAEIQEILKIEAEI
jgi:hypothetical protein